MSFQYWMNGGVTMRRVAARAVRRSALPAAWAKTAKADPLPITFGREPEAGQVGTPVVSAQNRA